MDSRDLSREVETLRKRTEVHVDEAWQERIVANVKGRRPRRFLRPALALSFACAAVVVVWGVRTWRQTTVISAQTLQFDANATGTRVSSDADAVVAEQSPARTRVDLRRGSVHFEIGHTGREFQVVAGPVTVTVLGTSFTVARDLAHVTVNVQRGRVRVHSQSDTVELTAGQQHRVEIGPSAIQATAAAAPTAESPAVETAPTDAPAKSAPLAPRRSGKQSQRHPHSNTTTETPKDTVEDLMRAADQARQAQDWSAALNDYGRIVEQHAQDSRAGLASFSMGRILLHQAHRPVQAAHAFADARRLPLSPGLAREALAREIEAWHAAHDDTQARARAEEYVRQYSDAAAPAIVREVLRRP